jgi:adenosylmethionine-8-amino-7-oxononanoate aminotransferase
VREIADAIAEQAAYSHRAELTSEPMKALAREPAPRTQWTTWRLFLVTGGPEAAETEIKLAR